MVLDLNDALRKVDLDPADHTVLVARHSHRDRRVLALLHRSVAEDRRFLEAYQSTQTLQNEARFLRADYLVSCLAYRPGTAVFAGLYRFGGTESLTASEDYWAMPGFAGLRPLLEPLEPEAFREGTLRFDLQRVQAFEPFVDRLEIDFSNPVAWLRDADRNTFPIVAIHPEPVLIARLPQWEEMVLSTAEIASLAPSWQAAMSQWRGIYCITDVSDGRSYVGSAAGAENIYGRWMQYAVDGDGGNAQLRGRDPSRFRFSVLQLTAPDMPRDDVIRIEEQWMRRLQTRVCGLNRIRVGVGLS